jgi:alanyl-tRNA synthetase
MTPTSRLYYQDSYTSVFDAHVVDRSPDGKWVYLDKTYFYPTSGGQPHDTGFLAGQAVLDVLDEGDRIAHLVSAPVSVQIVPAQIDWPRRYDHMQQHTGQHLLSAVLAEAYGVQTLSFHMGSEVSTIELGTKELTEAQIDAVESRADEIVREARRVRISFKDSDKVQELRKESSRTGTLRIVEIEGMDRSACGGTHVRSTGELGPIQIRKMEKVRGNVRIEFVCGTRALRRAKTDFRILAQLARESATAPENLPEHLAILKERLAEAEKERGRLVLQIAERDGANLYGSTVASDDGLRRALLRLQDMDAGARATASAFVTHSKAAILIIAEKPPAVLLACSPDSGLHAGAILKEVLGKVGGRGGGSATLAQGSLPSSEAAEVLVVNLGFGKTLANVR